MSSHGRTTTESKTPIERAVAVTFGMGTLNAHRPVAKEATVTLPKDDKKLNCSVRFAVKYREQNEPNRQKWWFTQ